MSDDFAEAEAARRELAVDGVSDRWLERAVSDAALEQRVTSALRSVLVRVDERAARAQLTIDGGGACTLECRRDAAVEHIAARVFTADAGAGIDARLGGDDDATPATFSLHVCTDRTCDAGAADERLHRVDVSDRWRRANGALVHGGVYWCRRHTRVHVCSTTSCRQYIVDELGFRVCVLSGRNVGGSSRQQYGHGTRVLSAELQSQRELQRQERREELALKRSSLAAVDAIVRTGNTHVDRRSPGGGGVKRANHDVQSSSSRKALFDDDDDANVYLDVDAPASDLFGDTLDENTFGDGIAGRLAYTYSQAYASVHLLLFSERRAEFEANVRRQVVAEAESQLSSYLTSQVRAGQVVSWPTMRQLELRALNARRHLPVLLVPENAPQRLTAYYSLVVMEFYIQLLTVIKRLIDSLSGSIRAVADRFLANAGSLETIAPGILDLLHEGLSVGSETLVAAEPLLLIFPEVQTMKAVGIANMKRCTESKKTVKRLVVAASDNGVPLHSLATTRLDTLDVIFDDSGGGGDDTSIVTLFLTARRRRLGID